MSCWLYACWEDRPRRFFWERDYPVSLLNAEVLTVGAGGTVAAVDRDGMVSVLSPEYFDVRRAELPSSSGSPEAVTVGPDGNVAIIDGEGMIFVLRPPYSEISPIDGFRSPSPPMAVTVGPDGTIAVVAGEATIFVVPPPYSEVSPVDDSRLRSRPVAVTVGPDGTIAVVAGERLFMGDPRGVCARTIVHPHGTTIPSTRIKMLFEFDNDRRASVWVTHRHRIPSTDRRSFLRWVGTEGMITATLDRLLVDLQYQPAGGRSDVRSHRLNVDRRRFSGLSGTMDSMMQHLENRSVALGSGIEDAYRTMLLVDAVHAASDRGIRVSIGGGCKFEVTQ